MADSVASLQRYVTCKRRGGMERYFLDIQKQNRKVLPPEITELECADKLELINASHNPGLTIPDSFDFTRLKSLLLFNTSRCGLTEFARGLCDIPTLDLLELSYNNLQKFPASLASMQTLATLCLHGCNLDTIPACITTLPAILELYLHKNKLQQIPATLSRLDKLRRLVLSHNQFATFPNLVCLEDNSPATFSPKNLKSLDLSHNQLAAFPEVVFDIPSLAHLALNDNKIISLPDSSQFRAKLEGIKYITGLEEISTTTASNKAASSK